jgi:hypothetical protein
MLEQDRLHLRRHYVGAAGDNRTMRRLAKNGAPTRAWPGRGDRELGKGASSELSPTRNGYARVPHGGARDTRPRLNNQRGVFC